MNMKVKDVMSTEVITITPDTTYEDAAKMLYENRHSGFPVVDSGGNIVGMLSEKNLFRGMYPSYEDFMADLEGHFLSPESREERITEIRTRPVAEFMLKDVVTIHPDAPIMRAGGIMLARGFYRLPVVEDGSIVGMVTRDKIFSNILKTYLHF